MADKQVRQFFQQWYLSELGQSVLKQETELLELLLKETVGYYLLMQSPLKQLDIKHSLLRTKLMLSPCLELGAPDNLIVANSHELPVESDGIDVHILHHTLELSEDPHGDLREAARSLLPSGKLIIVGFNPWSFWRTRQLFSSRGYAPWCAKFIAMKRLEDWLKVAGLTLESTDYLCYSPPFKSAKWQARCQPLDSLMSMSKLALGGVYVITATKQTNRLIPHKPRWRRASVRVTSLRKPTVKEIKQ